MTGRRLAGAHDWGLEETMGVGCEFDVRERRHGNPTECPRPRENSRVQRARGASFRDEPPEAGRISGGLFVQDLEGDLPLEARIAGAIDLSHATASQQAGELIRRNTASIRREPRPASAYCPPLTIASSSSCVHGLVRVAVCARRVLTSAGSTAVAV